jgi:tetratricopeptide (TPR) repeat protein
MAEHIPESELAVFAFDPDAVTVDRSIEIEQHTAACEECRAHLDFFSVNEEDLGDPEVWERSVGSATFEALRAYGERIAAEDEEAEKLLEPFFASPATVAMTNLRALGKRYRTGGVVRRLNARANSVCEGEPLDALTFAEAASSVAEALPDDLYPAQAVYEMRGTAWKEQARALHLLGRFHEAHDSLDRAERAYRRLASPGFGLANVALVRAIVLYEQQRLDEAATVAREAERAFSHLGDDDRRVKAMYLRACIRYEAHDPDSAMALFRDVVAYGEATDNAGWIARGSYALGNCEVDRGKLGEASMYFQKALVIFRKIGPATARVNTEWGIARVLLHAGKRSEAVRRLRDVAAELESRGMVTDMALVGLDTADALLGLGRPEQIVDLAARLFRAFKDAGMLTGALTALAYLKETAATGRLTPASLSEIRTFLRRAERQPELVFVPPPESLR